MPLGDKTGPAGVGPMTGRGAGYCAGYDTPGYMNPGPGPAAFGRGVGRRFRNRYYAGRPGGGGVYGGVPTREAGGYVPPAQSRISPEQEKEYLNQHTEVLKEELGSIKKRLRELEEDSGK